MCKRVIKVMFIVTKDKLGERMRKMINRLIKDIWQVKICTKEIGRDCLLVVLNMTHNIYHQI
jgi:hypothetical protein